MTKSLRRTVRRFLAREDGAVTVDWVVLTAAVIGMGMLMLIPVATGTESLSEVVGGSIADVPVGYQNN
jgi:Flp pilus assembly pilin Flp